jgi:hypothetical protein
MHLSRNKNKAVADSSKNFDQFDRYVRIIIDVYSSSEVNRDFWLTEREKEFYVSTIIHCSNGFLNPISEEAIQIYKKYFNQSTNKGKISDYINRIRKKGWIKYNKKNKRVDIPKIFHELGVEGDEMTFNLRFIYGPIDRRDTDGNTG